MRKLVLMCGILASVVSVSMGAMSNDELQRAFYNCLDNEDKNACQALIDNNGLASVGRCDKEYCGFLGSIYYHAGYFKEAIPYFEKAIALGDNRFYVMLGVIYGNLQDYHNAKKYNEIACNKGNYAEGCTNLGIMYWGGRGVRQDYAKAAELFKKACDMKEKLACGSLAMLYVNGEGVRQNFSIAKQYFGKACDFGAQAGCEGYKLLHNQGVQ